MSGFLKKVLKVLSYPETEWSCAATEAVRIDVVAVAAVDIVGSTSEVGEKS